ncbi:MAG: 23S rRNA (uracil(1939)-C(5))-methyltransferase RlmD [Flavobacteriaceae bacterium]|nr:23S rRNA (uracil(1939)-C(5))-methyltransferase RlmD [Flavobacteriaceae bacterium]
MSRKKGRNPRIESLEIVKYAAEGKGLGYYEDKVVFVANVIPGDIVEAQVSKKRKNYYEAFAVRFLAYSEDRTDPFCEHFGVCGGCKWQNLPYEKQLSAKEQEVLDNLERIGKVEIAEILPIKGAAKQEFYRNKLEFTFSADRWLTKEEVESNKEIAQEPALGFHVPRFFDKVVDIQKCFLQPEPSNPIRNAIREYALEKGLPFFHLREQEGFLRTLIIRTTSIGEVMVILSLFHEDKEEREALLDMLIDKFPEITSLNYVINEKKNDTITDQEIICYKGLPYIEEEMEGLRFRIGPKSFYQTNSEQAYELYKVTRDFAGLTGKEIVYDLYTGTGTIANFVAKKALQVVGVEYVPEAIEDAKLNSVHNGIENTLFYAGDMKDIFTDEFIAEHGQPDVVITDPPRAGMHQDVVETLLRILPKRIVYVSCNSATQARDLYLLKEKYSVKKSQAVDMFPHTHHIENVVLLELE